MSSSSVTARQNYRLSSFAAIPFLRKYSFDGLDMDWEYPKSSDKENFVALLKELRQGFEFEAEETGEDRLLLSAAVPVGPDNVRLGHLMCNLD